MGGDAIVVYPVWTELVLDRGSGIHEDGVRARFMTKKAWRNQDRPPGDWKRKSPSAIRPDESI
jgi:hypothetical protein